MERNRNITKRVLFTKTVQFMQHHLRLQDWRINVQFVENLKITADCEAHPEYKLAIIRADSKQLSMLSHYSVVSLAIHEMVHCIVWPLGDWASDLCVYDSVKMEMTRKLEESLVSTFERILTDLCVNSLQKQLTNEGYKNLNMKFDDIEINNIYA